MDPTIETVPGTLPTRPAPAVLVRAAAPRKRKWRAALAERFHYFGSDWLALTTADPVAAASGIRDAMLAALPESSDRFVRSRVRDAKSVQALWYLRCDVAGELTRSMNEEAAAAHMEAISLLFDGLLPRNMKPRRHTPIG